MNYTIYFNLSALKHRIVDVDGKRCIALPIEDNHLTEKPLPDGRSIVEVQAQAWAQEHPKYSETHTIKQSTPREAWNLPPQDRPKMPYLGWLYELKPREEQTQNDNGGW